MLKQGLGKKEKREAHDYGSVPAWCAGVHVAVCGAESGVACLEGC